MVDIEVTRCATIDLQDRLESSRVAFSEESLRVNEPTADLKKKYQAHATEVAAKVKALTECGAVRTSEQEMIEKLEAKCNEISAIAG